MGEGRSTGLKKKKKEKTKAAVVQFLVLLHHGKKLDDLIQGLGPFCVDIESFPERFA